MRKMITLCVLLLLVVLTPITNATIWTMYDDCGNFNKWDFRVPTYNVEVTSRDGAWNLRSMATYQWGASLYQYASVPEEDIRGIRADISLETDDYSLTSWGKNVIGMQLSSNLEAYIGFFPEPGNIRNNYISIGYRNSEGTYDMLDGVQHTVSKGDTAHEVAMLLDSSGEYIAAYIDREIIWAGMLDVPSSGVDKFFIEIDIPSCQDTTFRVGNFELATIPEPATLFLLGLGGLIFRKRQI